MGLLSILFGCSSEPPFTRDGDTWRYRSHALDVDAATFRPLGSHYARDASQVIYADTYRDSRDYFTTARLRVTKVAGADLASFAVIDDDHARDAQRVYYEGKPFAVKDVATFVLLDYGYARDKASGYYLRTVVPGSEGASFAVAGPHHAKDARQVWWCDLDDARSGPAAARCRVLDGADPAAFQPLERGYAKSGTRIYHRHRHLPDVDAATFAVDDGYSSETDARDARGAFNEGQRVAAAASAPA